MYRRNFFKSLSVGTFGLLFPSFAKAENEENSKVINPFACKTFARDAPATNMRRLQYREKPVRCPENIPEGS